MANDFSDDANCVALFKFDNNANDSKGGNDLTAVNSPSYDSGDKKEGSYSADLEESSTQYFTIADGDLDAGFPGKSGTSEQSFSICLWVKVESTAHGAGLVSKYVYSSDERTYLVYVSNVPAGELRFIIGYSGGVSYTTLAFDTALSTGIWYHIAAVYDASDNSMKLRVWDDNAGALLDSNATGTADGNMSPDSAPLEVGRAYESDSYTFDGKIDEVVIFKDVLSDSKIDQIRAGSYGAGVTEKNASDAGAGVEAIIARLLTDYESGNAIEAADVEGGGQPKDLSASETGEGTDRLVAKIEIPAKGGGLKLWI
jgi:hypothetical protein